MGELKNSQSEREIDYLYGNYSGKSDLDKRIKKAEELLNQQRQNAEDNLEALYDQENLQRLKRMDIKSMSFLDVENLNLLKKKYSNTNKSFDGSDVELPPSSESLKSQIVASANALIPLISSRGVSVQPIPEGADLQTILGFCTSFRDALRNSQAPVSGKEIEPDNEIQMGSKYSRDELEATKKEIEKMLAGMK